MRQKDFQHERLLEAAHLLFGFAGVWVLTRMLGIKETNQGPQYLQRKDIIEISGMSPSTVDKWLKDNRFPRKTRAGYRRTEVINYLEHKDVLDDQT